MTTQTAQQTKSNEIIINREVVSFSCWYYKVTKNGETLGKFETREQAEEFVATLEKQIVINRVVVSFSYWYFQPVNGLGQSFGKFETREQAEKFVSTI